MEFEVALTKQHLESLAKTQPLTGIIELIWNALDADATEISVEFGLNEMEGVDEIRVRDNGHGILAREAESFFGALGESWKRSASQSRGGRTLHGRDGRGRYRAAGIGSRIIWRSVAADPEADGRHMRTQVALQLSNLIHVTVSEPEETSDPAGTLVVIPDLGAMPPIGLGGDGPVDRLTATFALWLQTYKAHITYDRTEIDPSKVQVNRADYALPAEGDDALLTIVEWNRHIDRGLYLCDSRGTPLSEQPPGIQAPGFAFTAYLQWTGFEGSDETDLLMANLESGARKVLIESAKDQMRDHFSVRLQEKTREQIKHWKEEKVYPFSGDPRTETEQTVRDVFDVVALSASDVVNASEVRSRRLSLRLLREALEQDPGSLHRVLHEVLDLPQDRLDELGAILDQTPLSALIATSREIANRLDFVRGLEELVLDPDIKRHVKERSQLHRILAGETWIFGEEYSLSADDESLTTVLKRHVQLLDRDDIAMDALVKDSEGHTRVVDLMLARSLEQNRNRREHLVIELKAPSVKIGDEEALQIRRYANAVVNDPRFNTVDVQWDFYVISTEVRGISAMERESDDRPFGQITNSKGVRIWALTWAEIIEAAKHRLKFVEKNLNYHPTADQALVYLRRMHEKYLPPQVSDDVISADQTDLSGHASV